MVRLRIRERELGTGDKLQVVEMSEVNDIDQTGMEERERLLETYESHDYIQLWIVRMKSPVQMAAYARCGDHLRHARSIVD